MKHDPLIYLLLSAVGCAYLMIWRLEVQRRRDMSKVSDEIKAVTARFDAATTQIGQRIRDLTQKVEDGAGDSAATEEALTALRAEADQLEAMGADGTAPETPPVA